MSHAQYSAIIASLMGILPPHANVHCFSAVFVPLRDTLKMNAQPQCLAVLPVKQDHLVTDPKCPTWKQKVVVNKENIMKIISDKQAFLSVKERQKQRQEQPSEDTPKTQEMHQDEEQEYSDGVMGEDKKEQARRLQDWTSRTETSNEKQSPQTSWNEQEVVPDV